MRALLKQRIFFFIFLQKLSFRFWDIQILQFQCLKFHGVHSVHGVSTPLSKTPPLSFLPSPPPTSANWPSPPPPPRFRHPPRYWFFEEPLKIGFSHESQKYCFSFLTSSYFYKVIKFSVKISHFEYLVMTEKNIFVYKLFCQFRFYAKSCPPEKGHPLLRSNHPLKIEVL